MEADTLASCNNGNEINLNMESSDTSSTLISDNVPTCDLAAFLIQRASRNEMLANFFYWYLLIECENHELIRKQDEKVKNMYIKVLKCFKRKLAKGEQLVNI